MPAQRTIWTEKNLAIALDESLTLVEAARKIGTTKAAVAGARWRRKNPEKYAEQCRLRKNPRPPKEEFVPAKEVVWDDSKMDLAAAQHMWASKILLMIDDACGRVNTDYPSAVNKSAITATARRWFDTRDFLETCELAGLQHERVYAAAQKKIAEAMGESAGRE